MTISLKLGFIGLGIMGAPMAAHLQKAGHALFVHTIGEVPADLTAGGATVLANARAVAQKADIVFVMVPDTPDVEKVLFGEYGVASGLAKGKTVVDMSSIDPIATRGFAQKILALDCDYLDAPVSGGEVGAKAASLTIMVGGTQEAFDRVRPLFELMGKNITLVGGADPARVRAALMGGFASSRILEVHGERMIKRTFAPGFRIGLHQKDLNLALQGARALGVALPQTASAAQLMQSCVALGHGQADHSALVLALENMAQHPVAPDPAAT